MFCWVNPASPTETSRFARDGRLLVPGIGRFEVGSPSAGYTQYEGLGDDAAPDQNIYEWMPDLAKAPVYHQVLSRVDALVGDPQDPTSYVQETVLYERFSIDDLLFAKMAELDAFVADYRLRPFLSNLSGPKGWFTNDTNARDQRNEANSSLQDQMKDILIDGVTKTYWRRDIYYIVIRDSTGQRLAYPMNESEWGQLMKAAALHQDKMQDSYIIVVNEYDVAHSADDWDTLAGIDPADPARWQEVYRGPISNSIKVVGPVPVNLGVR